jgi:xylulokinase
VQRRSSKRRVHEGGASPAFRDKPKHNIGWRLMSVVAGIDSSTQSCTVVLYDFDTQAILSSASAPHPPTSPPVSEQDPLAWQQAMSVALDRACKFADCSPSAIVALSVAAQHHGLVALNRQHEVVRPAKLWNDTCSAPQASRLVDEFGRDFWVRRTGSVPTAAFTVSKLVWLGETEPDNFRLMELALLPHDWLTKQLCGRAVSDRGDSSGTGYFDARTNAWCEDVLARVDPDREWVRQLPEVLGPQGLAGQADTAWSRRLGLNPKTLVAVGTGDQTAAAVGLGLRPEDVMIALGTSGVVSALSPVPVTHPDGLINCIASATGGFQPTTVTLNAAKVTDAFARWLGVDHQGLSRLALSADVHGAHRPVLAPFLDGERTPDRPYARGLLAHLSSETTRADLALSAYEGVALNLLFGFRALVDSGLRSHGRLLVTGGASHSPAYRTVLASLFRRPVSATRMEGGLASARGAALQAAAAFLNLRVDTVAQEWAPASDVVAEPRPDDDDFVEALIERYNAVSAVDQLDHDSNAASER